ncbi:hypothetical protein D3C84_663960 [compost metagenome]
MTGTGQETLYSSVTVTSRCTAQGCQAGVTGGDEQRVTLKATHTGHGVDADLTGVLVIVGQLAAQNVAFLLQDEHALLGALTSGDVVVLPFGGYGLLNFRTLVDHHGRGQDTVGIDHLVHVTQEGSFFRFTVTWPFTDQLQHFRIFEFKLTATAGLFLNVIETLGQGLL